MSSDARLCLYFDDAVPVGFLPAEDTLRDAFGILLAIIAVARQGSGWPLVKLCARPGCYHDFYDVSQTHVGKWFTTRCGNRVRTSHYRKGNKYRPPKW